MSKNIYNTKVCCSKNIFGTEQASTVVDISESIISLPDNASTRVDIPGTQLRGAYFFSVVSVEDNGSTGTFTLSCRSSTTNGDRLRLAHTTALTGEEIDMEWSAGNVVQLFHSTTRTGGTGELIDYIVRHM